MAGWGPGAGPRRRRGATLEPAVGILVIPAHDLLREPGLELAEGQRRVFVRIVGAACLGRATSGAWQRLELAHLRADEPFDVTVVVRPIPVDELNAVLRTAALESLAFELGGPVEVQ